MYKVLYNKLASVNFNISIYKDTKRIASKKVVDFIVRKLRKTIDKSLLSKTYKRRFTTRIASIDYYSIKHSKLIDFSKNNINCENSIISICDLKIIKKFIGFSKRESSQLQY